MECMDENIIYDIYYKRYPYAFRFGSYHAILRSLTIAKLVDRLYVNSRLSQQTYDRLFRTRQLIRTLILYGPNSPQSKAVINVINHSHKTVNADNEDFLYVLSSFFLEPLRWNSVYGTISVSHEDTRELILFWRNIGYQLNIRDLFDNFNDWTEFQSDYERRYMKYSDYGHQLAIKSIDELCLQAIPFGFRRVAKQLLYGTIDENVREALGLPTSHFPVSLILKTINYVKPNFEPRRSLVESSK